MKTPNNLKVGDLVTNIHFKDIGIIVSINEDEPMCKVFYFVFYHGNKKTFQKNVVFSSYSSVMAPLQQCVPYEKKKQ